MKILIYEDSGFEKLFPLNMLRANYDIFCGVETIKERTERVLGKKFKVELHCRNYLSDYLREIHTNKINFISKDDYLLLNGRIIFADRFLSTLISKCKKNTIYKLKGTVAAVYISKDFYLKLKNKVEDKDANIFDEVFFESLNFKQENSGDEEEVQVMEYPWDTVKYLTGNNFQSGLLSFVSGKKFFNPKDSVNFIGRKKIYISKTAKIFPGVVIDASEGTVIVSENAIIQPFSYIKGPTFIGENCLLKSGVKIYGPCAIGRNSKVAGEIGESILHSYVNKQHDGFIGHSYICPFVNLGADTVTSDLKNNYSSIRIKAEDSEINSGLHFLGSIIGDHTKTSINTMLNTGSMIGIFANIFGGGFHDKTIKSFSWNESGKESKIYDIDKALETAQIVMGRRGILLSGKYRVLVKYYFEKKIN